MNNSPIESSNSYDNIMKNVAITKEVNNNNNSKMSMISILLKLFSPQIIVGILVLFSFKFSGLHFTNQSSWFFHPFVLFFNFIVFIIIIDKILTKKYDNNNKLIKNNSFQSYENFISNNNQELNNTIENNHNQFESINSYDNVMIDVATTKEIKNNNGLNYFKPIAIILFLQLMIGMHFGFQFSGDFFDKVEKGFVLAFNPFTFIADFILFIIVLVIMLIFNYDSK